MKSEPAPLPPSALLAQQGATHATLDLIATAHAGDGRSVLIELTDSGRRADAVIAGTLADLEHRALKDLPAEAIAGFHAILNALTEEGS